MEKKNHEIRVKLSKEEYDKLKKKAEQIGMPVSSLMRYLALKSTIRVTIED